MPQFYTPIITKGPAANPKRIHQASLLLENLINWVTNHRCAHICIELQEILHRTEEHIAFVRATNFEQRNVAIKRLAEWMAHAT